MRIVSIARFEYDASEASEESARPEGSPVVEKSPVKQENVGYFCCLPGLPDFGDFHDFIADGDIQRVREPLFRRDCSY